MKQAICCSYCGKPQGSVSNLVLARKDRTAAICNECLEVCRKILVKSGTEPIADPPESSQSSAKTYYRIAPQPTEPRQLICSFCGTPQHKARRLIGSRPGQVRGPG